ncbi:unnamed protein product, partial [Cyprideis torosa]
MSFKLVIPARFASSRLPGKPLLDIAGKPMLQRVYERALQCGAEEVIVATDEARIVEAVQAFGGDVVMTSAAHPSGTDRIAEVAAIKGWENDTIVVNLQGDEPLMPPSLVQQVAHDLANDPDASIATLCTPIELATEFENPNCVKVVFDRHQRALYFSRSAIPYDRDGEGENLGYRHLGMYAFRVGFLQAYTTTTPCPIEVLEKL